MNVPIDAQVTCVQREIRLRDRVYAHRVAQGKMTKEQAAYEITAMKAVLTTLLSIAEEQRLC